VEDIIDESGTQELRKKTEKMEWKNPSLLF